MPQGSSRWRCQDQGTYGTTFRTWRRTPSAAPSCTRSGRSATAARSSAGSYYSGASPGCVAALVLHLACRSR